MHVFIWRYCWNLYLWIFLHICLAIIRNSLMVSIGSHNSSLPSNVKLSHERMLMSHNLFLSYLRTRFNPFTVKYRSSSHQMIACRLFGTKLLYIYIIYIYIYIYIYISLGILLIGFLRTNCGEIWHNIKYFSQNEIIWFCRIQKRRFCLDFYVWNVWWYRHLCYQSIWKKTGG